MRIVELNSGEYAIQETLNIFGWHIHTGKWIRVMFLPVSGEEARITGLSANMIWDVVDEPYGCDSLELCRKYMTFVKNQKEEEEYREYREWKEKQVKRVIE